ncbi:MAG: hypothetical protein ACREV4_03600 [Gammaproteobacteria bacterium]
MERRKAEVGYVKTAEGFEVDFHARCAAAGGTLIQVRAEPGEGKSLERELRALAQARREYPRAERLLLVLNGDQARVPGSADLHVLPAYERLLDRESIR